ncbi:hypothetical protein CDAR_387871 [Caerostris darwini]|uniref:Uncharacterized protein n=1 Tax=Caerostris darwini TaxID=1538125 RepID=A0AAV4SRT5_9ARAC|nr:hypothetical protein CDAR_387871 [Caerostris darwini]
MAHVALGDREAGEGAEKNGRLLCGARTSRYAAWQQRRRRLLQLSPGRGTETGRRRRTASADVLRGQSVCVARRIQFILDTPYD